MDIIVMEKHTEALLVLYKILIRRDLAVPVDLTARLIEAGIDLTMVNHKETE
tara:strand:- start:12695 stop:12850 length:156 start_codon:yes stop_codon:yes gene_type:complete